jgi:hypothetical protein
VQRPVRILKTAKDGTLMATPIFLLHLLQNFYEELNLNAVRRKLADVYSANLLTISLQLPSSDSLLWGMSSIPHVNGIKSLIFNFFRNFIEARVQIMMDSQMMFNGQGLRFDGNFDMARQVAEKKETGVCCVAQFLATVCRAFTIEHLVGTHMEHIEYTASARRVHSDSENI